MNEEWLFAAALERATAAELQAFLAEACAGDVALRRRMERLLAAHDRSTGILDQTALLAGSVEVTAHADHSGASGGERVGAVVAGRYKMLEEIGSGGMGTVWVAEQTQPVRRKVALKLIRAGMDSRTVLSRFEAERQALALMDHPHIAKVLDGGLTPTGQPFFVMELVNGLSLTKFCDEARLTTRERLASISTEGILALDIAPLCPEAPCFIGFPRFLR
jgi:eukaryotic-like serine/threonine-protein kinase